ncbi:MAG: hypothetical protein EHM65_02445, partial [Acidobacteriales bacterium]
WMTANSHAVVKAYDHATGVWSEDKIVGRSTFADKHNYPGMLRGADNRIYIFYGCHNSPLRLTVSPKPLSIDGQWSDVSIPEAAHASYPAPIVTNNGDFYVFYRETRMTSGHQDDRPFMYVKSTDNGKSWSAHMAINPYPREDNFTEIYNGMVTYEPPRNGHKGRIHMAWTFAGGGFGRHAHATYGRNAYYAWFDPSTGQFHSVDGTDLGDWIDNTEADSRCVVLDTGHSTRGHLAGLQVSAHYRDNGFPFVHFQRQAGGGLSSATWNGSAWVVTGIPKANGEPRGLEKIGPDSFRVYNPSGRGVNVYRTDDAGASWRVESTIDAGQSIDRCLVITNYHPDAKLLLTGGGSQEIEKGSRDIFIGKVMAAAKPASVVANQAELDAAIASAKPGDTIVMRDGIWKDARLELKAAGTASAPVTLRAQTPGQVVLTGASSLVFAAPHVTAEGLVFRDGALSQGSVITFRSDYGLLAGTAIVNYNPPELNTAYYWVFFEGSHNRVERSLFERKNHMGPLIGNAIKGARYNSVSGSHFLNIGSSRGQNGMEIFRVWGYGGSEEMGDDGAFFTIERNLFERADGESAEIISLKSNRNRVLNNTIRATLGGITNRSGNFNTIAGNIILCEGRKGCYGMRVTGQRQRVQDNYIAGCDYGIMLLAGEFIERDLTGRYSPVSREGTPLGRVPRYNWPRQTELLRNTLVNNSGADLILGGNYKSGWPGSQRVLIPEDNFIANNVIVKAGGGTVAEAPVQDSNPPLDVFKFKPNRFEGNIVFGGEVRLEPRPDGFISKDPRPVAAPQPLSPADVGPSWAK